jgi:gamma-glutamyl hercynylcysteine S-oxide synthase
MNHAAHAGTARSTLLTRLAEARRRTDALFDLIPTTRLLERPIAERHRFIFYVGHIEAFDGNLFGEHIGSRRETTELDTLFAFGIDPLDGSNPHEAPSAWPDLAKIRAYNRDVRRAIDVALPRALDAERLGDDEPADVRTATLVNVAIEHRLMHAETLAYMMSQSSIARRLANARSDENAIPDATMVCIPAGAATLGADRGSIAFGWDNEFGSQRVDVPAFEIARCMVSNGEYLRFVAAGGYYDASYWTADDWAWRVEHNVTHPAFWIALDRRWYYRGLGELIPLPHDWPVYVSHAEASAYARWAGLALPTEAQWHRAAYGTPDGTERAYPWGDAEPDARRGNFDFESMHPVAVDAKADGDSAFGVRGLLGNGWEWTSTPFAPLRGFEAFPFYAGYSANFFDGRHFVMKGGSPMTAAPMLRRSFRNWFQPHYPYVYAGFRCVAN